VSGSLIPLSLKVSRNALVPESQDGLNHGYRLSLDVSEAGSRQEIPFAQPERHVDQTDECWNFDERPDDSHERLAGVQSEDGYSDSDGQLEIIACRGEAERREGAHVDAVLRAEAGTITCSGAVHDGRMSGAFRFVPDVVFVNRMLQMGYRDLDEQKLQAYALFRIGIAWVHSLQAAGVSGIDSGNLIALRIFQVDADYIRSLNGLGYPTPDASKLIALRVQHVDPEEVKEIRAMGYQPTLDELIQMRIFKVTPDFIRRMQAKGLNNLTISKLVQIRIFKLAE
jgi:hypothetical protein